MADESKHPSVVQKIYVKWNLDPSPRSSPDVESRNVNGMQGTVLPISSPNHSMPVSSPNHSMPAEPAEKGFGAFMTDFLMGGVSAAVSKNGVALIEHVKLLIQNQDEMIKSGRLSRPYRGISDCFARTMKDEGMIALWRGNTANVIRYFPTQVSQFHASMVRYSSG